MIYAIQSGDRTVALTNNKNDALRFPEFELHWANESERAKFRELAARRERRWWPAMKRQFEAAVGSSVFAYDTRTDCRMRRMACVACSRLSAVAGSTFGF